MTVLHQKFMFISFGLVAEFYERLFAKFYLASEVEEANFH